MPDGIKPLDDYLREIEATERRLRAPVGLRAMTQNDQAKMVAHARAILDYYEGVQPQGSFIDAAGTVFDAIPVEQQHRCAERTDHHHHRALRAGKMTRPRRRRRPSGNCPSIGWMLPGMRCLLRRARCRYGAPSRKMPCAGSEEKPAARLRETQHLKRRRRQLWVLSTIITPFVR